MALPLMQVMYKPGRMQHAHLCVKVTCSSSRQLSVTIAHRLAFDRVVSQRQVDKVGECSLQMQPKDQGATACMRHAILRILSVHQPSIAALP